MNDHPGIAKPCGFAWRARRLPVQQKTCRSRLVPQRPSRRAACATLVAACTLVGCTTILEPLTSAEIAARSNLDRAAMRQTRLTGDSALTFGAAIAHALANNLDLRIASLDAVIARGTVDLSDLGKMPALLRSAGYTWRDPPGAASDKLAGDRERRTYNTEFSWNVLDFGVSYLRAKQAGNEALIAAERSRRVANSIINDVRLAYWQASLGGRRLPELRALTGEIAQAMKRSRQLAEIKLQDPLVALNYQDGLLELQRQIKSYETEILQARLRLMRLLNAYPVRALKLVAADPEPIDALRQMDRQQLEEVALATRGELREADYTARNRRVDVINAFVQAAPALRLRAASVFDSTSSLLDNHWSELGYTLSFNFLGVVSAYQRAQLARLGVSSAELRRLTLSLAVMEQVALARDSLAVLEQDYALARETSEVRRKIWELRKSRLAFSDSDELERSRAAVSALAAGIREDRANAALQRAYGDLLASLGVDQFPADMDLDNLDSAASSITHHLKTLPVYVSSLSAEIAASAQAAREKPVQASQ